MQTAQIKKINGILLVGCAIAVTFFSLSGFGIIPEDWFIFNMAIQNMPRSACYLLIAMFWWWGSRRFNVVKTEKSHVLVVFLFLVMLSLDNLGNLMGWYQVGQLFSITWYDSFTHFTNSGISVVLFYIILTEHFAKSSRALRVLTAWALAVVLGTFFEMIEYLGDIVFQLYMVEGEADTMGDFFMNLGGTLLGIGVLRLLHQNQHDDGA